MLGLGLAVEDKTRAQRHLRARLEVARVPHERGYYVAPAFQVGRDVEFVVKPVAQVAAGGPRGHGFPVDEQAVAVVGGHVYAEVPRRDVEVECAAEHKHFVVVNVGRAVVAPLAVPDGGAGASADVFAHNLRFCRRLARRGYAKCRADCRRR